MRNELAFKLGKMGRENKNNRKIIDWKKVFKTIKENNIKNAEVGLKFDFDETKGLLMVDGTLMYPLIDNSAYGIYLGSVWATPILYDLDNDISYDCYYEVDYDSNERFTSDYLEVDGVKDLIKDFKLKEWD